MHAVGKVSLAVSPHLLLRIEFGRVAGKPVDMEALLAAEKRNDLLAAVDFPTIPGQDHVPTKVPQEVAKELNDLRSADVLAVESGVESQASTRWGCGDAADDRDSVAPVAVPQQRGAADRSPGPANVGNKEKAALVEEGEMCLKSAGFFLSAARPSASNGRWPSRRVAWPAVSASAESTASRSARGSTPRLGCSEPHAVFRLDARRASTSTVRWSGLRLGHPSASVAEFAPVVAGTASEAAQTPVGRATPSNPLAAASAAIGSLNSATRPGPWRRTDSFARIATTRWLAVADAPTTAGFHEVSCFPW